MVADGIVMTSTGNAQTVVRALTLLSFFSEEHPTRAALELSHLAGLKQSTTHRLLGTLESLDFLERDGQGRYKIGLPVIALAAIALDQLDLYRISLPILSEVTQSTGLSSTLAVHVASRRQAMYIARIDSSDTPRGVNSIGKLVPLHASAVGRVLLAGLPSHDSERLEDATGVSDEALLERLRGDLAAVHRDGFALDEGELLPHRTALSAPVLDGERRTLAALALSGPRATLDASNVKDVIGALTGASDAISYALGNTSVFT